MCEAPKLPPMYLHSRYCSSNGNPNVPRHPNVSHSNCNPKAGLCVVQGYQSFTQALGVLEVKEARDAFLSSLCTFALPSKMAEDPDPDLPMSPASVTSPSGAEPLTDITAANHRLTADNQAAAQLPLTHNSTLLEVTARTVSTAHDWGPPVSLLCIDSHTRTQLRCCCLVLYDHKCCLAAET